MGVEREDAEGCRREQLGRFTHVYVPKIKALKAYPQGDGVRWVLCMVTRI